MPILAAYPKMLEHNSPARRSPRVSRTWLLGVTVREYRELGDGDRVPDTDTRTPRSSRCWDGQSRIGHPHPSGIIGALYIADRDDAAVSEVAPNGMITTLAGTDVSGFSGDGGPGVRAKVSDPENVVVDRRGRVFFTDEINERVRMIDVDGTITTAAGTGDAGDDGDGGPVTQATLNDPYGLALDAVGNLYVAYSSGACVRKIARSGTITTFAGKCGVPGFFGDGALATQAQLGQPSALAVDIDGNLYIGDWLNGNVRMVDPQGVITIVVTS
jgi:hypothetical protein